MFYELATLTLPFGTAATAAQNVQAFCTAPEAQGELLACWFTDIGPLNQMIVLRGFADLGQLQAERARAQTSASPFGCGGLGAVKYFLSISYQSVLVWLYQDCIGTAFRCCTIESILIGCKQIIPKNL